MKKIAYFDCFAGVSGDMLLGALLDAGVKPGELTKMLSRVRCGGYRIEAKRVLRAGIAGTKVTVRLDRKAGKKVHGIRDILALVRNSSLPEAVSGRVELVFNSLARAEARVHGGHAPAHFHECGAVDAIVDVVGVVAGVQLLGIDEVYASALPWNWGTVECAHGTLPVPAPAVAEIMKGIPVYQHRIGREMVTPTGAAILKNCVTRFGVMPPMRVACVGYGAGSAEFENLPNLLRLVVGEADADAAVGEDVVAVIQTAIDDMPPTFYNYLSDLLFAAGALDVFTTPVLMKKGRPGQLLTVLCVPAKTSSLAGIIFTESTTLGVRIREEHRIVLERETVTARTSWGRVRVKLARRPDGAIGVSPEYDDCARIAAKRHIPLRAVMDAAARAAARMANRKS